MTMDILGISAYYHDSAACLLRDGEIVAAAQEERFTRRKHDARFPRNAVRYCLREGGVSLQQLRHVAFYDKPLLKFERLLETYLGFSPRGIRSFVAAMPVWLNRKNALLTAWAGLNTVWRPLHAPCEVGGCRHTVPVPPLWIASAGRRGAGPSRSASSFSRTTSSRVANRSGQTSSVRSSFFIQGSHLSG